MSDPAYVLDSTAFYAGIPYQGNGRYFTTYMVLEEVKHHSVGSSLIHTRVQVTEPTNASVSRVRETAKKTGDSGALSQTSLKGGEFKNITWKIYCKGCGKQYTNPKLTRCLVCGTDLARKASTK